MRGGDEEVNCGTHLRDAGPGLSRAVPEGAAGGTCPPGPPGHRAAVEGAGRRALSGGALGGT